MLKDLERWIGVFGEEAAEKKLLALRWADRRRPRTAKGLHRLHDLLLILRAWPDSPAVLAAAEKALARFSAGAHRARLADSGIAGTETRDRFFYELAGWLASRWPDRRRRDGGDLEGPSCLDDLLPHFGVRAELPGLEQCDFGLKEWVERMRGPFETDAAFLVRRLRSLPAGDLLKEELFDRADLPFRLLPGPDTPSRTRERLPRRTVAYQSGPLDRSRPDLSKLLRRPDVRIRAVPPRQAREICDLARGAMAVRHRDLEAFAQADPRDVRLADGEAGMQVALIGVRPERRFLLETIYGYLLLKNGVLVGYGTGIGLFRSCEIAFNLLPPFRGYEASRLYAFVLCAFRTLFDCDTFTVDPYQIGEDNDEALDSGAWWFYAKLGFRPFDDDAKRLAKRELDAVKRKPSHRTSRPNLVRLARAPLFLQAGRARRDVLGVVDLAGVGLAVSALLAERFGSRREEGERALAREAAALLGARNGPGFRAWGPLVLALPGVETWPAAARRALAGVVQAKAGRRESDYLLRFDAHGRLREAVLDLARAHAP